jgi:hypothetical protein
MPETPVDFVPVTDPLFRDPPLDHHLELPILGLTTRFETNSRYVLDVIEECFGMWRELPGAEGRGPTEALRVGIIVHHGSEGSAGHAPVRHRCPDPVRMLAHSPGSLAVVDPTRREAVAYVSTELVADREHFRREFLEAIVFSLVTPFDRHPIHAAAIGHDACAVLLAGPSGAGKSTLAYLAHRAGLGVLSEDIVWVQLQPRFRLWGSPRRVHLLPTALGLFPDLDRAGIRVEIGGRAKIAVDLVQQPGTRQFTAERAVVCLLQPGGGPPQLERIAASALRTGLRRELATGFDRQGWRLDATIEALTQHGGWRLELSPDPREALDCLRRMLESCGE